MYFQSEFFVIFATVCLVASKSIEIDPITEDVKFLVAVDGKSFFVDSSVTRNWMNSKIFCNSLGMNLASITTQSQSDALRNAYNASIFHGSFWTSGRDAWLRRQFSWDTSGQEIPATFPDFELALLPSVYQTCLYYYSIPEARSGLRFSTCTDAAQVLCESSL